MEYDAEDILGFGDDGLIDWENLLNFDYHDDEQEKEKGNDERSNNTTNTTTSSSSSSSSSSEAAAAAGGEKEKEKDEEGMLIYYKELEKELMNNNYEHEHDPTQPQTQEEKEEDDDIDNYIESFIADVLLVNSPPPSNDSSDQPLHPPNDSLHSTLNNNNTTTTHPQHVAADNPNADDPISKKRTRQLRNRDAAVKSRERKKMYVKDLETKARYLEAECRKLGRLLHCCYAENHALRYTLHMSNASGAPMAKQESAVLFLELLLLGSLLWFLGITCLLNVPIKFQTTRGIVLGSERNRDLENQAPREAGAEMFEICVPSSHVKSRRCRGGWSLGHICYHILAAGLNGYMATVTNLKDPVNKWRCGAAPLAAMMAVKHWAQNPGALSIGKPAIHPATEDLKGKAYELLRQNAAYVLMNDIYTEVQGRFSLTVLMKMPRL